MIGNEEHGINCGLTVRVRGEHRDGRPDRKSRRYVEIQARKFHILYWGPLNEGGAEQKSSEAEEEGSNGTHDT